MRCGRPSHFGGRCGSRSRFRPMSNEPSFLRARGVVKGTMPAEEAIRRARGGWFTDSMIAELVDGSRQAIGCTTQTRHCCDYHAGFEDALALAQERLGAAQ